MIFSLKAWLKNYISCSRVHLVPKADSLSMFSLHLFMPRDLNQLLRKETPPHTQPKKGTYNLAFYASLHLGHNPKSDTCLNIRKDELCGPGGQAMDNGPIITLLFLLWPWASWGRFWSYPCFVLTTVWKQHLPETVDGRWSCQSINPSSLFGL